jgi:uncharacterized protein with beta-barrel porin domain
MTFKHLIPFPVVAFAAMVCSPAAGPAQSILLTAGNFTLLGGTAITSTGVTGTTIRNGNVGLAPGATSGITGFPPAVVTGGAIIATGGVTSQARLDLITASVGLAGMASNANMSTVDLGGKTLAPGVYTFNGAASLSGALVLDAQGQNNVAWVFQIGTALTTSINSTVTFINLGSNGGSDLGLFWNAGSAVVIGANNQIAGNYLAGTSITFGGLSAGGGRALALAGISLDNNIINAHGGFGGGDFTGGLFYSLSGAVVASGSSAGGGTRTIPAGTVDGGLGTIGGNVTNNGILSPGVNSPGLTTGALTVAGNFVQTSTGTLVIQIASGTSFDQLNVTGTAALAGTLQVDTVGGYNPLGQSFTVLNAAGGVSGKFATVTGSAIATNRAAVAANITYGPTSVTVAFAQLPFAGFALTPNQIAVANAAQASPALTVALDAVPLASQFPAALNSLSPQGYEIWSDHASAHATALAGRMQRDDEAIPGQDNFYFDGSQNRGRGKQDLDVGTSTFTSTAFLVGGNRAVSSTLTAGAFFEHAETTADLASAASRTNVKDNTFGFRAAGTEGTWFTHAMLAYGMARYNSTRPVAFPGVSAVATSSTRGHQWLADLSFGKHLTGGTVTLSPFAGLLASRWQANGFTETGAGAYNATLANQSAHSLRTQLGLEARLDWKVGSVALHPHVRGVWLHELSNGARRIDAAFDTINFAVSTRGPQRDCVLASAGLDVVLGPRALLYTDFTAQTGGVFKILSEWRAGLSVRF